MFQILAGALAFFYGIIPNYAIAIALLTLTVMLVLAPLTLKSTRSMLAMQQLQPEVKKIQQKYKGGDAQQKQQMQQEMMALYKEHQVNPMSGCLPMLVQLPVLFVMYHVIRGLTQVRSAGECPGFDAKYLDKGTELFRDLCASNREMVSFGVDLSKSASQALEISVIGAIPFVLLTGLVAFVQYYQSRQMSRRNPQATQNPQIQMMTRVMPVMFGVFSFAFPAALNVYWFISGLFRVTQQAAMYRWDPSLVAHARERTVEAEAKVKEKPGSTQKKPMPRNKAKAKPTSREAAKARGKDNGKARDAKASQGGAKGNGTKSGAKDPGNGKGSAQPRGAKSSKKSRSGDARSRKRRAKRGR
ncbi:MAG: YidC/Oxa1 family membrane protein insertase [Actinomycetota bacterium]|nr:YidC/Oxa1 family membrane protein insertase [Actinomycetota bacterium]